jgi:hypothetical protein
MDPATIIYLAMFAVTTIKAQENAKWSRAGWHGLSHDDKRLMVQTLLKYSYEAVPKIKQPPFTIFWEQLLPYISRPQEKIFPAWLMLNEWIFNDPILVPYFEAKYKLGAAEIPNDEQIKYIQKIVIKEKITAYLKNPIIQISGAILIILIIAVAFRARK